MMQQVATNVVIYSEGTFKGRCPVMHCWHIQKIKMDRTRESLLSPIKKMCCRLRPIERVT